jgi:hypothetical protein
MAEVIGGGKVNAGRKTRGSWSISIHPGGNAKSRGSLADSEYPMSTSLIAHMPVFGSTIRAFWTHLLYDLPLGATPP